MPSGSSGNSLGADLPPPGVIRSKKNRFCRVKRVHRGSSSILKFTFFGTSSQYINMTTLIMMIKMLMVMTMMMKRKVEYCCQPSGGQVLPLSLCQNCQHATIVAIVIVIVIIIVTRPKPIVTMKNQLGTLKNHKKKHSGTKKTIWNLEKP